MIKVNMLKTPGVEIDGRAVVFPFKRVDALLYYMLVRRSATRQELISLLWESYDEGLGLKNLRNTLYALKRVLGGDFLVSPQKAMIVVNPEWEIECDYDKFVSEGDFEAYKGEFLQGFFVKNAFAYEEWLERMREQLHGQFVENLSKRATKALEEGDIEGCIRWAEHYLREEPYNEEMNRFLMERYRQERQYPKAAQIYQRLKKRLSDDLGADPLEETTAFYYEILNEWNNTTQPAEQMQNPIPVGREAAFHSLSESLSAFVERDGRAVSQLLVGEVGSGKSELLHHFLKTADLSGLFVLRGVCVSAESSMPLTLWRQLMPALFEFLTENNILLPAHVRMRLGQSFALFREGDETGLQWPHLTADDSLLDCILLLLVTIARRKRLLFVVENLQWMDQSSLSILEGVIRRLEQENALFFLTYRENYSGVITSLRNLAGADRLLKEVRFYPLTCVQTEEFLRRELGGEAAHQLSGQFYRETGGNLHLLTELTQAYQQSSDAKATIEAMSDILMDRLTGISETANKVAELISVFQKEVSSTMLLALMDRDDQHLGEGLEELFLRGLLEEKRRENDAYYSFTHQRIQELVNERLTFFKRAPLHLRVAQLLERDGQQNSAKRCSQIAYHYKMAGEQLQSVSYEIEALELESVQRCEPFPAKLPSDEPIRTLDMLTKDCEQGLTMLSQLRRTDADPNALTKLEHCLSLIRGRLALFQGKIQEGTTLLGALSDGNAVERRLMIKACYLLAQTALYTQGTELAERYTTTGLRLLEREDMPMARAKFRRLRGGCLCQRGEYEKSTYHLMEAESLVTQLSNGTMYNPPLAEVYYDCGRVFRQQENYIRAVQHYKDALALIEDDATFAGTVWLYVHYGRIAFAMEDHTKANELFGKACEMADRTGELWGTAAAFAFYAYYQGRDGNYETAQRCIERAEVLTEQFPSPLEQAIVCLVKMLLKEQIIGDNTNAHPLAAALPDSSETYARRGIRILSDIPDVFEREMLNRSLREGIRLKKHLGISELYSKNKHFMAE